MRSIKLIVTIMVCSCTFTMAQEYPRNDAPPSNPSGLSGESFWDRVVFGGSLGAQFGDQTLVNVAPTIGYRVTDKLTSGIGITYIYYSYKYYTGSNSTVSVKGNIYGGSIWSQYRIIPEVFLHAEYGMLNLDKPKLSPQGYYLGTVRGNVPFLLLGGGYFQPIGEHAGFQLMILYDVVEDQYSPYSNPIIRIGFVAGM